MERSPILVGVCGGTASGKTSLCTKIYEALQINCTLIQMDSFYKGLAPEKLEHVDEYNFDHPDALDFEDIRRTISTLMRREPADVPLYDFTTHSRLSETNRLEPNNLILYEGIYALYDKDICDRMDLKIFVQTEDDVRLSRRLLRDTKERGRSIEGVLSQYFKFVKPSFDEYIRPTMKFADIIVPHGAHNQVAIDLIVMNLKLMINT